MIIFIDTIIVLLYSYRSYMTTTTLSPKLQMVIPLLVREQLKLKAGDRFEVMVIHGGFRLEPIRSVKELRGTLKGMDTTIFRNPDRKL